MTAVVFADSSAVVRLYADEPGADAVRAIDLLAVSQLARVEVPAALWRKHRIGELSVDAAAVLTSAFEADYFGDGEEPARFTVVGLTEQILERAARLVGVHGLRAYDGVQLATATAVMASLDGEPVGFAADDKALCSAAAAEGLVLQGEWSEIS
ncbi:MAG TPA: type II toxin-antitoxin system VapC family toxin [Micromonosporaceae bacterium]